MITGCGRICYQRRKINVSQVFGGQRVGVKQTEDHLWLVTFMDYGGYPCLRNEVLPMSPEWTSRNWLLGLDSNQQPSG